MYAIIVILICAFCMFAAGKLLFIPAQKSSHSSKKTWRNVLVYCVCVYVIPWLYVPLWKRNEILAFGLLTMISAIVGVLWQIQSRGRIRAGAIAGGFYGSQLSLLYHLIFSYTILEYFEDLNFGFHLAYIVFSPVAAAFGGICGCIVWLAAAGMMHIGQAKANPQESRSETDGGDIAEDEKNGD